MKFEHRTLTRLFVAVATGALTACGGGGDDGASAPPPSQATADAPVAAPDAGTLAAGGSAAINVLANDSDRNGNLDPSTLRLTNPPAGASLAADGRTLTVPGQGTWSVGANGQVAFASASGFRSAPSSIGYTVADSTGLVSNIASISLALAGSTGSGGTGSASGGAALLAGTRWIPLACGDLLTGGANDRFRPYNLYTSVGPNVVAGTGNTFQYSGPGCSGSRSFFYPESTLVTQNTVTFTLAPEVVNGYTVYRGQAEIRDFETGAIVNSYQLTHITTPEGWVCRMSMTESDSAAEIVESHLLDSSKELNCGVLERF